MLSVLLGAAFFSRQLWGVISDRIGGLYTMLAGSACQALGMAAFLLTQDEVGSFTVAALFGAGFSGLVPANILTSRESFPVEDAYWRMPTLLLCSGWGMATGGWLAGILYDRFGFYAPAFAARSRPISSISLLSARWCCGARGPRWRSDNASDPAAGAPDGSAKSSQAKAKTFLLFVARTTANNYSANWHFSKSLKICPAGRDLSREWRSLWSSCYGSSCLFRRWWRVPRPAFLPNLSTPAARLLAASRG